MTAPIIIRRTLPGRRERVFAAWTKPELMCRWLFPMPGWIANVTADLREGGHFRLEMRDAQGGLHLQHGQYRTIEPVSRLVFTWTCEALGVIDSLVTVELEARGDETALVLQHVLPPDPKIREEHEEGWVGCLAQLERFLKPEEQTAMSSIKDSVRINVPLARAMEALTTQQGYTAWWSKDCTIGGPGGEARLKFDKQGTIVNMSYRIDRVDPSGSVKWTCIGHDIPAWVGTTLNWSVVPDGAGVEVKLDHAGWKEAPPEPVAQGWKHFLGSMKAYLETGTGQPW